MADQPTAIRPIAIAIDHAPTINFALQQNHVPVVRGLRLTNPNLVEISNVEVRIWSEPKIFEPWQSRIDSVPAEGTYSLNVIDLIPSAEYLMTLTEAIRGTLHVEVHLAGDLHSQHASEVELLAYDDWNGLDRALPDIIAAFVQPNHPRVQTLLLDAARFLDEWTSNSALSGYQTKDRKRVVESAAAIFSAIHARSIVYCNPPASFERTGQKVRLPDAILTHKLATCLDLTLLFAACLEQAGLFPLIVITRGHAFVGVWLVEECFADAATDEPLRLRKRVDLGEILVFETTVVTANVPDAFKQAVDAGRDKLIDTGVFETVIDIQRCRKNRIRPLPIRVSGDTKIAPSAIAEPSPPAMKPGDWAGIAATANEIATERESPETRLDRWKRKLLDLTLHNRLINFKESKKTVPLICADLSALEDALHDGDRFALACKPSEMGKDDPRDAELHRLRTGEDALRQMLLADFGDKRLRTNLTQEELDRRTLEIYRAARTSMEEGGANSLFLAIGFLSWYESQSSGQQRLAPIILLPVELLRSSVREGFRIRQTDEEPRINVTLLELLTKDFGLSITGLDPIPQDENGLDVKAILNRIREAIKNFDRWDVLDTAQIGMFSFAKFLMWRDLEVRTSELVKNKVVKHLVFHAHEPFASDGDFPDPDLLDRDYHPKSTYCPLPSDSSQLAAVFSAAKNRSFVLFGPPGTGKSQTITNLISHCLATGKTVLFVSEKMAALNVVQNRLAKVGLGAFCLELHSNKSQKIKVIEQLGQALGRGAGRTPADWDREAQRLAELRQELNEYVEALHQPRSTGESIFRGISQLIGLKHAPMIGIQWGSAESMTRDRLESLREVVDRMMVAGEACGHPKGHIWSGVRCRDLGPALLREIEVAIARLTDCIGVVEKCGKSAGEALGINALENLGSLEFAAKIANLMLNSPKPPAGLVMAADWSSVETSLGLWRGQTKRRDELENSLFERYKPEILDLDLDAVRDSLQKALAKWAFPRWIQTRSIKRQVANTANDPKSVQVINLSSDLKLASDLREEIRALKGSGDKAASLLGEHWRDGRPDWAQIDRFREWCMKFRKYVATWKVADPVRGASACDHWAQMVTDGADTLQPIGAVASILTAFVRAFLTFADAKKTVEAKLSFEPVSWGSSPATVKLEAMRIRLAGWSANLKGLRAWCGWQLARKSAIDSGLTALAESYERDGIPTDELRRVFDRSFYQWWVETMIEQNAVLRGFSSAEHERRIQRFREFDQRFMVLTIAEIQARLSARQPGDTERVSQNSEMGVLKHQLQKRRAHLPVRTLFQKIPNLLPKLKPCLLMSPNSVAQFLDPSFPKFDLVVFDEASQMPAWDAVGAIARGNEVIVVGDPKQLPPTNFFGRADEMSASDAEDAIVEDLESILDDCIASQLPQMELRWHYRSRHESLIAFSNHHYYDNNLLTFPSPHIDQGVKFHFVSGGFYDRGKSRSNPAEADALVAEVVRRLNHPELSKQSLGIVTFSMAQQSLIEDKLEEVRRSNPSIEPFFTDAVAEPVFVKNLENVQGDERDVILFSICYGPDKEGRVSVNFGPLNRDGGERRLNVAVTRARQEISVFATLRADQIDLSRSRSRGVQDLRCFLDYAERGSAAISSAIRGGSQSDFESPFEKQVCEAIRRKGHTVHTQVGCSGYRIDLAIVEPNAASRYLLAIECDGANYHSAKTARDRDKLREAVLTDLGWRVHRVWSSDWWADPETELVKIESAIADATAARTKDSGPRPAASQTVEVPEDVSAQAPQQLAASAAAPAKQENVYKAYKVRVATNPGGEFYDSGATNSIREVIRRVVEAEGPISLDLLAKRVIAHWGLARRTEAAMDRVERMIKSSPVQAIRHDRGVFVWPLGIDVSRYDSYRVNGETEETKRDAADIPPEEIASAARRLLKSQVSLPRNDLLRELGRVFGFQRVGQGVLSSMSLGVDLLVGLGDARAQDGRIRLAD